jgi:hypothetical protein
MNWIVRAAAVGIAATCVCSAQTISKKASNNTVIWSPPRIHWPEVEFPSTVQKEMIGKLRIANFQVVLEETELEAARKQFGGTIGYRGDGGDSEAWLCLHGSDAGGPWIFWLTSGELDGPAIMGFQWRRLPANEIPDRRCALIPLDKGGIQLPLLLNPGMTESEMEKILGKPSFVSGKTLIYCHEHREMIHNLPYLSDNLIAVVLRDSIVLAIEVSKSTSD